MGQCSAGFSVDSSVTDLVFIVTGVLFLIGFVFLYAKRKPGQDLKISLKRNNKRAIELCTMFPT